MTPEQQPTGVLRFFSNHPIVGLVVSICTVISVPLSIYLYLAGQQTRELVFAENPIRTVLVEAGRPSDLKVEFKGQVLDSVDVVAVQVAVWNRGKASIKPDHMLAPLEIRLDPPGEILSVSLGKHSRDVAAFKPVDAPEMWKQGRAPVSFRILERNDGGAVQIVFAGRRATRIDVASIVEGQGNPRRLELRPASGRSFSQGIASVIGAIVKSCGLSEIRRRPSSASSAARSALHPGNSRPRARAARAPRRRGGASVLRRPAGA